MIPVSLSYHEVLLFLHLSFFIFLAFPVICLSDHLGSFIPLVTLSHCTRCSGLYIILYICSLHEQLVLICVVTAIHPTHIYRIHFIVIQCTFISLYVIRVCARACLILIIRGVAPLFHLHYWGVDSDFLCILFKVAAYIGSSCII